MSKKYEIINEERRYTGSGHYANRIRALRDIPRYHVKKGDLGGFIWQEGNLSHDGDCWVGNEAVVDDNARVEGDALVRDKANVRYLAVVSGKAEVSGFSKISGKAHILDNASVMHESIVKDHAYICDNSYISNAIISGRTEENAYIGSGATITQDGIIKSLADWKVISPVGPLCTTATVFRGIRNTPLVAYHRMQFTLHDFIGLLESYEECSLDSSNGRYSVGPDWYPKPDPNEAPLSPEAVTARKTAIKDAIESSVREQDQAVVQMLKALAKSWE